MDFETYAGLDGLALGELVRRRDVSAAELLELAIARTEAVNPQLNAVIHRFDDAAREAARRFSPSAEPFAGVPTLLKDIGGDCAGVPTRFGSAYIPPVPMPADSYLVAKLKRAGLIPFGKTNVPEFGLPPMTESRLYGPARNPWDLGRTPGGSSGGSAASVAAGIVPVAHANDGGGSIRIPAACCGLVGLKPTRGRTSLGPNIGDLMNGLVHDHVVTRTVRDSAAALDALAGYEPGDPYAAPPPDRPFLAEVTAAPRKLRIGFTTTGAYGAALDPEIVAATEATARLLAELGHEVEEARFDLDAARIGPAFLAVYASGLASGIAAAARLIGREPNEGEIEAMTWNFWQVGKRVTAVQYLHAIVALQQAGRAFAQFFASRDIWLTPSLGSLPLPVGLIDFNDPATNFADPRIAGFALYNPLYNLSGQPAITLPLHQSAAGLPIGMMFGGRYAEDSTLLNLAAQLEAALPWRDRRPNLA